MKNDFRTSLKNVVLSESVLRQYNAGSNKFWSHKRWTHNSFIKTLNSNQCNFINNHVSPYTSLKGVAEIFTIRVLSTGGGAGEASPQTSRLPPKMFS